MTNFYCTAISFNDGFIVDIVDNGTTYSAWIYHEDYGVKSLKFSIYKSCETFEDFISMVKTAFARYEKQYRKEYMD